MLRQIHIFFEQQHIFVKDFAKGFGDVELKNVQEIIRKYMVLPIIGKTLNRKISNFQIFHRGEDNLYFLFVTDLVDTIQYIEKFIKITMDKFSELFPEPLRIRETETTQNEFSVFLNQIQKDLRSKISIIGPSYAGKTTLYNLLRGNAEKTIIDFAKSSSLNINGLSFELWDFQLRNNFSPLWSKFISGSDLVILVFNLGNYHLKIMDHFRNLQKLDSNLSKVIIIGNKRDLVEDDDIKRIKNELNIHNFVEISLNSPDAEQKIKILIKEIIGLKEDLPQNFEEMVKMADNLAQSGKNVQALAKYKELVNICTEYQDLEQIRLLKSKIDEINIKIREQTKIRREFEKKIDFAVPAKVKFEKKISVKPLPSTLSIDLSLTGKKADNALLPTIETSPKKLVAFQEIESKPSRLKIIKPTKIQYKAKKVSLPPRSESELKEKTRVKMPLELFPPHEDLVKEIEKPKIVNFKDELQKIISEKGSSLSLKLSETLLTDLEKSLGRPLTIEDVTLAAEFFVKQDQLLG